jgi:hypothetical protein
MGLPTEADCFLTLRFWPSALPPYPPPPPLSCSNATLLEDTIGSSIDGMAVTAASEFPKSFAISAAQDPGERAVLARCPGYAFAQHGPGRGPHHTL